MKAPIPQEVIDVVMEEAKACGSAATPEEEDISGEANEAADIAEQKAEEEADEGDEGDDFVTSSDETEEEKVDPAMYEFPHPPLSPAQCMLYYALSAKKRNELWDLRREAAREKDPDVRRDLYDEADAAVYEALRLLKLRQDNAVERKAELARRAQEKMGGGLDEKHQDPSDVAEPSIPVAKPSIPKQPGVVSRLMSGVAGMNPFQRG
jgi:hypothetical protein